MEKFDIFKKGLKDGTPILIGYLAVGFACGAIGIPAGFSIWQIAALGFFMNAGSAHVLTYTLVSTGAMPWQVAIGVAFINLRYILISTYMAQFFSKFTWWQKLISGLLITDENFGVATGYAKKHNLTDLEFPWMLGVSLIAWTMWWVACILGAILASQLPLWLKDSLGFSLTGMFIGLVVTGLYSSHTKFIDILVIIASAILLIAFHGYISSHVAILLTCIIGASFGLGLYIMQNKGKDKGKNYESC